MSKAFTKEDDGPAGDRLEDLPQSPHPNYVTPSGLEALRQRLADRRNALAGLRTQGDGFDSRLPIAMAERDIRFLEERINRAIPVDPAQQPKDVVAFGAEVEVADETDARRRYRIVGEDEADPGNGLIAPFSPLARALIGARVGDLVEWRKPGQVEELEIIEIRFQ